MANPGIITQLPTPPDWNAPHMRPMQLALIAQFETTLPLLVAKLDELAPFIGSGLQYYEISRSTLIANAYAALWDLPGSIAMSYAYVKRHPDNNSSEDINRFSHLTRNSLDLGDIQLFDTGSIKTSNYFDDLKEKLFPFLQEDLIEYPLATISFARGRIVGGTTTVNGWNAKAVTSYLRQIVSEVDAENMHLATDPVTKETSFVSRL